MDTETQHIADQCAARPDVAPFTKIVGAWVWVEFPARPSVDTRAFLKGSGFRWNKQRNAWQHPCGVFRPRMKHGDPRSYYGSRPLGELDTDQGARVQVYENHDGTLAAELSRFQAI